MKQHMILKEHIQHAEIIDKALSLCQAMLARGETLYPFAAISIDNDIRCLFLDEVEGLHSHASGANFGMIEKLERLISINKIQAKNAVGLLVYAATLTTDDNQESDALVLSMCDGDGENTLTLYPYEFCESGIDIGRPYSCDFSD